MHRKVSPMGVNSNFLKILSAVERAHAHPKLMQEVLTLVGLDESHDATLGRALTPCCVGFLLFFHYDQENYTRHPHGKLTRSYTDSKK